MIVWALDVCSANRALLAVDDEAGPRGARHVLVSSGQPDSGGLGDVEGHLPLIPGRLAVRDVDGPFDLCRAGGELSDHLAGGTVTVDPKDRGLSFKPPHLVSVEVRLRRFRLCHLGPREPLITAANSCNPDGRVNLRTYDRLIFSRRVGDAGMPIGGP